jgi:hypothetical protein
MTKPLTLRNREDNRDVGAGSRDSFPRKENAFSPPYFDDFQIFCRFLALPMHVAFKKRCRDWKHQISPAAAIMAIV